MEVTPLPDLNEFVNNMRSFEVSDTNQVVIYDNDNLQRPGRLWWILKYIDMMR